MRANIDIQQLEATDTEQEITLPERGYWKLILQLRDPGSIRVRLNEEPAQISKGWIVYYETPLVLEAGIQAISYKRNGSSNVHFQLLGVTT